MGLGGLAPVADLLRLACFLGFVGLGLWAARPWRGRRPERRRLDALLLYVVLASTGAGLLQRESWPFTTWALVHGLSPETARSWAMEGVDAGGRTWPLDPRILQPLAPEEFGAWLLAYHAALSEDGREQVGRFLLVRAEAARRRLRAGHAFASNARLLGPLAAPYHFALDRHWRSAADVPDTPFVGVRVFAVEWDVKRRAAGDATTRRRLILAVGDPLATGAR